MNDIYVSDIENIFANVYPIKNAETWDNVGLLIGDNYEVTGVLIALDITNNIIDEAIENNCNVIITHHPFIFSGLKSITTKNEKGKVLYRLIQNNIAVYTAHTNADNTTSEFGTAYKIFDILKDYIPDTSIIDCIFKDGEKEKGTVVNVGYKKQVQLGFIVDAFKNTLDLDAIAYVGKKDTLIKNIAICTGSGMSYLPQIIARKDIDLYITADIKYHEAMDAKEAGLCLIDLTHYASEILITETFESILKKATFSNELNIVVSKCYEQPFSYKTI